MTTDFHNKIAVITGATGYLGSEIASTLASAGMRIALLHRGSPEADTILRALPGEGHRAYQCDLANTEAVTEIFVSIEKEMGAAYACIHAAGNRPDRKQLTQSSVQDIRKQFEANSMTSFNFLTAAATCLRQQKEGVLIGVTTIGVAVTEATRLLGGYIPAKFAVQGMLAMLKEELKVYGVRVYSVAPGFLEGGMNDDIPAAFVEMARAKSKTGAYTTKEEVAQTILSLCSPNTSEDRLTIPLAKEYGLS